MLLEPLAACLVVGKLADQNAVDGRPGLTDTLDLGQFEHERLRNLRQLWPPAENSPARR